MQSFPKTLAPGTSLSIPLQLLLETTAKYQVVVHVLTPESRCDSCAVLLPNLAAFREDLAAQPWVRCGKTAQNLDVVLSAFVESRVVAVKGAEEGDSTGRPNRVKFRLVPWLVISNALPYPLSIRFFYGRTPREEVVKLAPGQERGFLDVGEHDLVQFKVDDFNSNHLEWSAPVLIYREEAFTSTSSAAAVSASRRAPRPREDVFLPHLKEGLPPLPLVMERSTDPNSSLRCVLFSTCWVVNYADVGLSIKTGKTLLGSATQRSVTRSASFLFPPAEPDTNRVSPALMTISSREFESQTFRVCGVLGWERESLKLVQDRFWTRGIQPVALVQTARIKGQGLSFSKPKFSFPLAPGVRPCEFVFQSGDIRFVSISVRHPDPPFHRTLQLTIRSRYLLFNARDTPVLFKELTPLLLTLPAAAASASATSSTSSGREMSLQPNALVPFHFSTLQTQHSFCFSLTETMESGPVFLDQTKEEAVHCVALCDLATGAPNATRVRVALKPSTNGTITVRFTEDGPRPMFKLDNATSEVYIEVRQLGGSHILLLEPNSTLPFGFEHPTKPTVVSIRALKRREATTDNDHKLWSFWGSAARRPHRADGLVPLSAWQSYPLETVSEREPLRCVGGGLSEAELLVEGRVEGSSLVLRIGNKPNEWQQLGVGIVVKILSGSNFGVLRRPNQTSFTPSVVVSMGGKTKQNPASSTRHPDRNNPIWDPPTELSFDLAEVPKFLTCTLLNDTEGKREVLAVARIPLPLSLFAASSSSTEENDDVGEDSPEEEVFYDVVNESNPDEGEWIEVGSPTWHQLEEEDANALLVEARHAASFLASKRDTLLASVICRRPQQTRDAVEPHGFVPLKPAFQQAELGAGLRVAIKVLHPPYFLEETRLKVEINSIALSLVCVAKHQEVGVFRSPKGTAGFLPNGPRGHLVPCLCGQLPSGRHGGRGGGLVLRAKTRCGA